MSKIPTKSSNKETMQAYAQEQGVELPDSMTKDEMWTEVQKIMVENGHAQASSQQETESTAQQKSSSQSSKEIVAHTIQVQRPADYKLPDFVICANGVNFQIHFGKKVRVPLVVVNILKDSVQRIPAHRDMDTGEMVEESTEPRFVFSIQDTHYE